MEFGEKLMFARSFPRNAISPVRKDLSGVFSPIKSNSSGNQAEKVKRNKVAKKKETNVWRTNNGSSVLRFWSLRFLIARLKANFLIFFLKKQINLPQNAGQVEHLGTQVGQVGHDEHKNGFDDFDVMSETTDKSRSKPPHHAHQRAAKRNHEKGQETNQIVDELNVIQTHFAVRLEHVIKNLDKKNRLEIKAN